MRLLKVAVMGCFACAGLHGCTSEQSKEDSQITQTRMNDIDSIEGSISDEMIDTDQSTEEAMVDASAPDPGSSITRPAPKKAAAKEDDKGKEGDAAKAGDVKPAEKPAEKADKKAEKTAG